MTPRRSAWPAWAALVGMIVVYDAVAARCGWETMSATWRRWGKTRPAARTGLVLAVRWLDHHLESD